MSKMQDIRTIKTVESIYNAFLDLMEKKSFQSISVKMLCQEARISRSTFYDHFEDKYHLVNCILRDMSRTVAADLVFFKGDNPQESPIFSLRDKYKKLLIEILHDPENRELYTIYKKVIADDICEKICHSHGIAAENEPWLNVTAEFYSGAIISVLALWLSSKQQTSQEELASYINVLLEPMHECVAKLQSISE